MENEYILGLDMGPTSIGWATVSCDGAHKPIDLLDANSRIFLSMLDSEGKVTKNKNRRDKRGMRKLLRRYRARRDELILLLVANGMLPGNIRNPGDWVSAQNADPKTLPESWSAFQRLNPFTCRENALTTEVSLHAMGRLLLHIAKRRGYRSNRGAKYVRLIEYLKNENLSLTVSEDDEVLDKETNSGDDTANSIEKETTTVLGGIRVLQEHLKKSTDGQLETAAQFVNRYAKECGHLNTLRPHSISISETNTLTRGKKKGTDKETEYRLFVNRKMIEDEFERIWRAQSGFLAISLSKSTAEIADLRRSIHAAIFFQRELKLQKNTVGMCSVLISRKRAPTALLESQDFLILQDLNHLRYGQVIEDDRKKQSSIRRHSARPTKFLAPPQPLGAKEREKVLETLSDPMTLNAHDCLTWDKLRTILGLGSSYRFSHEISPLKAESGEHLKLSKSGVTGNKTALAIGRTIPKIWHELPYGTNPGATQASASGAAPISRATRRQLVEDLLTIHDKVALFDRLRGYSERSSSPWHFSDKEALALTTLELTPAYIKHCERVLTEILPLLHEGAIYSDAIARTKQTLLKPKTNGIKAAGDETFPKLGPPPNIANPIVQKALYETRAVINKLIERQGRKPALIRIELGRDLRNSKKHRAEIQIQQNKNLALNEKAKTEIRHWNKSHPTQQIEISNDPSVKMVRLMIEQEYTCIFSYSDQSHQRTIGMRDIADSAVDICHIYPRGISGMDGYGNKVLAFRSENSYMGKRTPFQAWGHSDPEKYDVIVKRAEKWFSDDGPLQAKLKKIKNKASVQRFAEEMNDFTDAQLSDTRYIATAVRSYVLTLGYQEHQVQVVTGRSTATARRLWGLNSALPKLLSDAQPKIAGTSDKSTVESEEADETVDDTAKKAPKKDRRDHRHHAVDAIVIALTDIKLLKNILARYQYFDERGHFSNQRLHCPISDIQSKTAAITHRNVVSHSPKRKIWDALHADMPFGRATIVSDFIERKKKVGGDIKCTFERLTKDDGHEILWGAPDRDRAWLHDSLVRQVLQDWVKTKNVLPKQLQRDYPKPAGAESESLDLRVEHACLTKRVSIEKALDCVDRPPGVGSWIFDGRIRTILTKWRAETGNCKKTKLGWTLVDGKFPLMTPKKETPEIQKLFPIKRVKIASLLTDVVEFSGRPQLFETGSNHHVAIFRNISSPARKVGKVVTMLEASKRSRSGDIVLRNPNEVSSIDQKLIPEDWQFDMSLCAHDMVHMGSIENCDNSSIREKLVEQSALGLPIYRVQKFSKNLDGGILLVFRHFSVTSSADTDNRGVVRCSPHTLPTEARKVEIDPLGNWRFERRD